MAEKKFSGAPFGTQTARFDVTGVHPNTKIPGTFTQIPYDKPSTQELSQHCNSHSRMQKMDDHLCKIRATLNSAKQSIQDMQTFCSKKNQFDLAQSVPSFNLLHTQQNFMTKPLPHQITLDKSSNTNSDTYSLATVRLNQNESSNKSSADMQEPVDDSFDDKPKEADGNIISQAQVATSGIEKKSHEMENNEDQSPALNVSFPSENPLKGIEDKSMTSKSRSIQNQINTKDSEAEQDIPRPNLRPELRAVICLHTATSGLKSCMGTTKKKKSEEKEKKLPFQPLKTHSTGKCYSKSPIRRSILKPSKQSANDIKLSMSNSSSMHGDSAKQKKPEAESCETFLRRKMGPGAYNTIVGGFSNKSVEGRAQGPGWARQIEVERLASLPHLLYKEQWEENRNLKRKLGPGSYEIKDFIQKANEKPRSGRGICDNLAPRFEKTQLSATPGPGTYGIGGVPQRALEEKAFQATSTKGMLDIGDRKRNLPSVGSHLGPGTYRHKTCTDELLNKVTSLKGPYKLFSGDRNKPISEGYLAAPQLADLGPGQYEIGSFVDDLHNKHKRHHGKFLKMAQYPEVPTERLFLFSHAHCPKRQDVPGPGAYSVQELTKPTAVASPGFLSSAKRDDKMSQKFFTRNFNPVGAGRYDVQKFEEAQDVNGHTSVFKSKTGKPNLQMSKFLQERIRSKDVAVEDRVVINQACKMTRSITVM